MNLIPNFPPPPPLPEGPWIARILLESSGWPASLLALLGLCTFLVMNGRGDGRALRVLGLWLAGALLLWGLGRMVVTTREEISAATVGLVAAVARADTAEVGRRLSSDASLEGRLPGLPLDRAGLLDRVGATTGRQYPLGSWAVLEVQAFRPAAGRAQAQALIRVQAKDGGVNFSWWRIDWREEGGAWKASRVEPLAIQGVLPLNGPATGAF
jgi:hypothetical protein